MEKEEQKEEKDAGTTILSRRASSGRDDSILYDHSRIPWDNGNVNSLATRRLQPLESRWPKRCDPATKHVPPSGEIQGTKSLRGVSDALLTALTFGLRGLQPQRYLHHQLT